MSPYFIINSVNLISSMEVRLLALSNLNVENVIGLRESPLWLTYGIKKVLTYGRPCDIKILQDMKRYMI